MLLLAKNRKVIGSMAQDKKKKPKKEKKMAEQAPQKVKINDKEYNLADLSDIVKQNIASIRFAEQEMIRLQQLLAMAQTARNGYIASLQKELPQG